MAGGGDGMNMSMSIQEQLQLQRAIEESKRDNVNPDNMTYEEMLALGEQLGKVKKGFSQELIDMIPRKLVT